MISSESLWPWLEGDAPLVAFMGAGGKTRLLAESLCAAAPTCEVLVGTTTRIYLPSTPDGPSRRPGPEVDRILLARSPERLIRQAEHVFRRNRRLAVGAGLRGGKLLALPPTLFASLRARGRVVLVEADGARGCELKLWRSREPVLPEGGQVVCVFGCAHWGQVLPEGALFGLEDDAPSWSGRVLELGMLLEWVAHRRGAASVLPPGAWIVLNRLPPLSDEDWGRIVAGLREGLPPLAGILALDEGGARPHRRWIGPGASR